MAFPLFFRRPRLSAPARALCAALCAGLAAPLAGGAQPALSQEDGLLIQSTTSAENSGLYEHLLPLFTADSGTPVRVVAVGTGQALRNARDGNGDLLITHHPVSEREFIRQGWGASRHPFMHNEYVLVGPADDPAGARLSGTILDALGAIAARSSRFISRGDDSGTHKRERALWRAAGLSPDARVNSWYRESGSGMGATLNLAVGLEAYSLTDRATWAAFANKGDFAILLEQEPPLLNQYSAVLISPERHPGLRHERARALVRWLVSRRGQDAIAEFRLGGAQVFFPNAAEFQENDALLP